MLKDPELVRAAGTFFLYHASTPHRTRERVQLAEELLAGLARPVAPIPNTYSSGVLFFAGNVLLEVGQRQRCEDYWGEFISACQRVGVESIGNETRRGNIATLDGRLEQATEVAERIFTRGEAEGFPGMGVTEALGAGLRAWLLLGRAERALELIGTMPAESVWSQRTLCLAHLGRQAEVLDTLEKRVVARPGGGTYSDERSGVGHAILLEAAVLAGHRKAAELLLASFSGSGMLTTGWGYPTVIPRHMGAAAALLDRYEEARTHYKEALRVATEMKFRPEITLTRLQLAELLLEHYPQEKSEAIAHLDFAIAEFRDMKMQPSLERALRHKEILRA